MENLPPDYSRIFQFQSFDRTRRRILAEAAREEEGAMVTIVFVGEHKDNLLVTSDTRTQVVDIHFNSDSLAPEQCYVKLCSTGAVEHPLRHRNNKAHC